MDTSRTVLYSDETQEVYAFFKLEGVLIGTLDFVVFSNVDCGKSFVGKIHSIYFDKLLKQQMVELQIFYKANTDNKNEFYLTNHFVEVDVGLVQQKVMLEYGKDNDNISLASTDSFIVNDAEITYVGYYEFEITNDDEVIKAIPPILYDHINSWLSMLHFNQSKWYEHDLFDYLVQQHVTKITGIDDIDDCKVKMLNLINGKTVSPITNIDLLLLLVDRIKSIVSKRENVSVRQVYNTLTLVIV